MAKLIREGLRSSSGEGGGAEADFPLQIPNEKSVMESVLSGERGASTCREGVIRVCIDLCTTSIWLKQPFSSNLSAVKSKKVIMFSGDLH